MQSNCLVVPCSEPKITLTSFYSGNCWLDTENEMNLLMYVIDTNNLTYIALVPSLIFQMFMEIFSAVVRTVSHCTLRKVFANKVLVIESFSVTIQNQVP